MLMVTLYIFLSLLEWIVLLDVILSWTRPFGASFRYNFITPIVEPFYVIIKKIIPMRVGMFDFSPLILFLLIGFISAYILKISPEVASLVSF